jgi:pimeloyl-ACP methyl ester carboxylesterase
LHYVHAGSGKPPLVFVHGFGCSHEDWLLQIDELKSRFETVACDLRGHGRTPGRPHECSIAHYGGDVAALLSLLDLEDSILIGHSMGCRVVLEAARIIASSEHPQRVAGLVLIDGSRTGSGDPQAAEDAARATIGKSGYPAFAEDLFRRMFFAPSALAEAVVVRALRSTAEIGPTLWPGMARWDAAEMDAALAAVRCRVLAIQSTTRDPLTLVRSTLKKGETSPYLDLLRKSLKDLSIEIVPDTGHFTQIEAGAEVNRLIRRFAEGSR